jgi:surface polysaccharide O-acyltransferase-like enzyme
MTGNRIAYIDHIKVLLTCLVVAHHAAQAYGPTGGVWVVDDPAQAAWFGDFFFVNAAFMMGLYFFISGYFMVFSLKRKTRPAFLRDRFRRLGIPLLVFTFLVFLPFNYLGADAPGTVVRFFLDSYFHHPPIATGHLWFVASLLAYSIVYIFLMHDRFVAWSAKAGRLKTWHILVFMAVVAVLGAAIRLAYPIDTWRTWLIPLEPAHLPQYFALFLAGTFFHHADWLRALTLRQGLGFLGVAILVFATRDALPGGIGDHWLAESCIETLLCVGLGLGLLTVFRTYVNGTNGLISALSANAYGIYLVHVFVVIALQRVLLDLGLGATVKWLVVSLFGILISLALSALLRRNAFVKSVI